MASRFSDIVDAVETRLDDATVLFCKGRKSLHELEQPRRIVAIPVSADLSSHKHPVGGTVNATTGNREPAILTRSLLVEWHVWDATDEAEDDRIEDTEQLLHELYVAIRVECMGHVSFQSEQWVTQTEGMADFAVAGEHVVASTIIEIPVVRESRALTTITAEEALITIGWSAFDEGFDDGFLVEI